MFVSKEIDNPNRKLCPHNVCITMKIDIRKINKDESFDKQVLGNALLAEYNISNKAQFIFNAASEADAIKILKEKLRRLEDE